MFYDRDDWTHDVGMLVWVLASSMATESDAEKRRVAMLSAAGLLNVAKRATS